MILGAARLTVTREAAGSFVDGVWVPGAPSTFTVRGSVQPLGPREMAMLPGGSRTSARFVMYCDARQPELSPVDQVAERGPDFLSYGGRDYQVRALEDWTAHAGGVPHRAYVLVEKGSDEP